LTLPSFPTRRSSDLVEEVHRATQPSRASGFFSKKFGHACVCARAAGECVRMIAICGDDVIIVTHSRHRSGHDRFLADVEMTKAADFLRLILLTRAFLETPD